MTQKRKTKFSKINQSNKKKKKKKKLPVSINISNASPELENNKNYARNVIFQKNFANDQKFFISLELNSTFLYHSV